MRWTVAMWAVVGILMLPAIAKSDEFDALSVFNMGCHVAASPANGCLLTDVVGPMAPGEDGLGSRRGEACGWNVLALFAWGDLRIETAKRNGEITKVTSVGTRTFSLVPGFYGVTKYCTVVSGD